MTSRRVLELQRQKEIIERWLDIPGIPADAHQKLVEMLAESAALPWGFAGRDSVGRSGGRTREASVGR